jgi:fatty acid desaturase
MMFPSLPPRPDQLWGPTHPPIHWVLGALSTGLKQVGHEAGHSSPSSAKFKNV